MEILSHTSRLDRWHAWWEHRVLFEPKAWIQVEVTTACNAACTYCPRTVYRQSWRNRFLPLTLYKRLVPDFAKTELVYLQGWGEPLLHRDLPAMAAMAKQAGARVGTTTNGMLLNESLAEALVTAGLDIMAFSLVGTSSAYNDRIRAHTTLDAVLGNIALLERVKRRLGSTTPAVHIAYLMLTSGMCEIEALPALLKGTAVQEVVVSVLDFDPDAGLLSGEVLDVTPEDRHAEIETLFAQLRAAGRRMGISIHTPKLKRQEAVTGCSENIQNALCVSARGDVCPCVLVNLPVAQAVYCINGEQRPFRHLSFGNIGDAWLPTIWRHPDYVRWRAAHAAGTIPDPCGGCAKLWR